MKTFTQNNAINLYNEALDSTDASLVHEVASLVFLRLTTDSEKNTRQAMFDTINGRYDEACEHKTGLTFNKVKNRWQLAGNNQRKLAVAMAYFKQEEQAIRDIVAAHKSGREARQALAQTLIDIYNVNKGKGQRKHFSLEAAYNSLVRKEQQAVTTVVRKESPATAPASLKQVNKPKKPVADAETAKKYAESLAEGIKSLVMLEPNEGISEAVKALFAELSNNEAITQGLQAHITYLMEAEKAKKAA